jgi:hypothetical protein
MEGSIKSMIEREDIANTAEFLTLWFVLLTFKSMSCFLLSHKEGTSGMLAVLLDLQRITRNLMRCQHVESTLVQPAHSPQPPSPSVSRMATVQLPHCSRPSTCAYPLTWFRRRRGERTWDLHRAELELRALLRARHSTI